MVYIEFALLNMLIAISYREYFLLKNCFEKPLRPEIQAAQRSWSADADNLSNSTKEMDTFRYTRVVGRS